LDLALLYLYSYLVGSVPTAYLLGRLVKGIDIRRYGSGNVGGTNVFYHVGRWWIVPLGIFELFVKGASPIWIGLAVLDLEVEGPTGFQVINYIFGFQRESAALAGASLMTIVGHNWSVFLKFQGGRGLAVASGAFGAMAFYQLWIFVAGSLMGWYVSRNSAASILLSLLLLPLWTYLMGQSSTVVWYCFGVLGLVVLKRLLSNWTPFTKGIPAYKVLFNRLVRDRDISSREDWVHRKPKGAEEKAG
jgi:glycerol-3-phosphate acyltransferase PlsY